MPEGLPSLERRVEYFDLALRRWLVNAQSILDEAHLHDPPEMQHQLFIDPAADGLLRVVLRRADGGSRRAWAFIDQGTGDLFAAASWEGPEQTVHSNLFDANAGLFGVTWTGPGGIAALS